VIKPHSLRLFYCLKFLSCAVQS